jgi:C4-dicarboxylate-specific signal transduction histidine kinase
VIEYIGVTIDETERVHANAAMQEAHAELTRVARLTTMGELAGSIAHEINQPLAAVVANANAALRWLTHDPPNFGETKVALERIINNGTRASEVIGRIRELLKHRTPEHAPLNLNEAIGEVLELARGALRGRAVALRVALPEDVPLVLGDRVQLQQVIMNLMMNGADAMSSIIDRPRILSICSKHDNSGFVRVIVQDSGTGIDESIRHRIFDPLFTTKINGMGMGLAICRSIVEAHGGKLWTAPAAPYGTRFEFTIPSVDATQPVSPQ